MNAIYSPSNIDVLLHFHTTPGPHERQRAPAVAEAIRDFLNVGALEKTEEGYKITPLGKAWVAALCNVPPPKSVFVDEAGRIIQP